MATPSTPIINVFYCKLLHGYIWHLLCFALSLILTPTATLTMLTEALGGNCLTLLVGVLRQGEWVKSSTTMRHASLAKQARNFPVVNHGRWGGRGGAGARVRWCASLLVLGSLRAAWPAAHGIPPAAGLGGKNPCWACS